MAPKRLLPGVLLSGLGLVLFFIDGGFGFAGPQLPESALGYAGWLLVLVGIALLKIGTRE